MNDASPLESFFVSIFGHFSVSPLLVVTLFAQAIAAGALYLTYKERSKGTRELFQKKEMEKIDKLMDLIMAAQYTLLISKKGKDSIIIASDIKKYTKRYDDERDAIIRAYFGDVFLSPEVRKQISAYISSHFDATNQKVAKRKSSDICIENYAELVGRVRVDLGVDKYKEENRRLAGIETELKND